MRARAQRLVRRRDQDCRADRAGVRARRLQRVASAVGRGGGARGARRRPRRARARIPEHRPADGDRLPGRRSSVSAPRRGGQRARDRARVAGRARTVSPERRSRLRCARNRALVLVGPLVRSEGDAKARPCRRSGLHGSGVADEPRLAAGELRLGARPRPPRAVGAAHGPGSRCCDVGFHDAGDRGRSAGRRHADPARRGCEARRRARAADPRQRRHV